MAETPLLTETSAGFLVSYRSRQLYPAPPLPTAAHKAQSLPLEPNTLYFLASPLLWYGVPELAVRLPADSRLVLVEVDPDLYALCDWVALGEALHMAGSIRLVPPAPLDDMARALTDCIDRKIKKVVSIGLNAGRLLNQAVYQQLTRHAEEELRRYWRNQGTLLFMGRLWNRNLFGTIGLPGLRDMADHPRHPSVLVVGAGPSLDSAIPEIRQMRSAFFLVAVDTALPPLYRHGLVPDLIVVVEAQIANLKDFIPAGLDLPPVACDLTASPLVFRHFRCREHWLFASDFAPGHHWAELAAAGLLPVRIPALGSVGVAALYLCRYIATARISLVGLDFAWHAGATHAQDSPARLSFLQAADRLTGTGGETTSLREGITLVPRSKADDGTSSGGHLFTDRVLSSYRDSLNEVIAMLQRDGLEILDLRSQGLSLIAHREKFAAASAQPDPPWPDNRATTPRGGSAVMKTGKERQKAANAWLDSLVGDITRTISLIDRELRLENLPAEATGETEPKLLSCLARLDFLFHELPDRDWPNIKPGTLIRARIILDYYRDFILRRS